MSHVKLASQDAAPIAIVISRFNEEIATLLLESAMQQLTEYGYQASQVTVVDVPGAVEIPLITQRLARQGRYKAIVTLGTVIRGETSHYDVVCQQVSQGCQQIALQEDLPVIFGVLTTENVEQARLRQHKGKYCIDAAFELIASLEKLEC